MTIHEATALVLLYRACIDEQLQRRCEELVPGLAELASKVVPFPEPPDHDRDDRR